MAALSGKRWTRKLICLPGQGEKGACLSLFSFKLEEKPFPLNSKFQACASHKLGDKMNIICMI